MIIKGTAKEIPIVFSIVTYPVESGVIASLESSGNNLVGTRNYVPASRQYRHFSKIVPDMKKIAFVRHLGEPNSAFQKEEFSVFLEAKGISLVDVEAFDK